MGGEPVLGGGVFCFLVYFVCAARLFFLVVYSFVCFRFVFSVPSPPGGYDGSDTTTPLSRKYERGGIPFLFFAWSFFSRSFVFVVQRLPALRVSHYRLCAFFFVIFLR